MRPLVSKRIGALSGQARVPGDKSISHRALMLGALAVGQTTIRGLLEGEDVLATARALGALGANIVHDENGVWRVGGRGVGGLAEPEKILDFGNSGTGARLIMGILASHALTALITGDDSLCARPMLRVIEPLTRMGARFQTRDGGRLPLALTGTAEPTPIECTLEVASAQVKSAILLAALNTPGKSIVVEPNATRDHTERMLRHFGAEIDCRDTENGGREITLTGCPELTARKIEVPGDPSSAAFPVVAALITPDSNVTITGVGVNPLRIGLYRTLEEMGADISFAAARQDSGEPVADITVRAGALHGVEVPAERAPSMIDEYPILAVAAAAAKGRTVLNGLGELRVKESDRLAAIADGLDRCGVEVEAGEDSLTIVGAAGPPKGPSDSGRLVETRSDHRIAMAFLAFGAGAERPVTIDDSTMIETSFPNFATLMNGLGADIGPADGAAGSQSGSPVA